MSRLFILTFVCAIAIMFAIGAAYSVEERGAAEQHDVRLHVASAGDTAVLIDDTNRKTWVLHRSADSAEGPVWVPIKLLDDQSAVDWLKCEATRERLVERRKQLQAMADKGLATLQAGAAEKLRAEIDELEAELEN